MEIRDINTLTPASYNPRTLSKHDGASLERSIKKFGDISGITKNVRTGNIVTGHQRIAILCQSFGESRVKIHVGEQHEPDEHGTVANGFVVVEGTNIKLSYRETSWDEGDEMAANIAANRVTGQFDLDLLGQVNYEISKLQNSAELLQATGQHEDEINKLLGMVSGEPEIKLPDGEKNGFQTMSFTLSDEQAELLQEALGHMKSKHDFNGMENLNSNGNALYFLAREYLDQLHGIVEQPQV